MQLHIRQLYELQELDWKLTDQRESLEKVQARLADDSALTSAREREHSLSSSLEELSNRRRSVERTIADYQAQLSRVESRLYSGAVTSEKELTAAKEEQDFTAGRQREAEDELLEIMVNAEDVEAALKDGREKLERIEIERPSEVAELRETEEELTAEISELEEDREAVVRGIPVRSKALYDSLRRTKNDHAVAKVERGLCTGCRLTVPNVELKRARTASTPVQCGSCRRILFAE